MLYRILYAVLNVNPELRAYERHIDAFIGAVRNGHIKQRVRADRLEHELRKFTPVQPTAYDAQAQLYGHALHRR